MSDLKIEISADVAVATKQVAAFGKEVSDLGKDVTTASTSISKINPALSTLQTGLAKTAIAAAKVDSTLAKTATGTNTAAFALTNLGRVAQDAPFGFIGIQNNLNPLLESFQRLKAETGSTGSALKALGSSLIGAGGLGLALSLVSSAVLLYQQYTQGATKETKEQEKAIQLSISTYDKFKKELEQVVDMVGKEATKVSILFSALSESNIGLRERKGIIEQLNQISPGYLGNLDKEKAGYQDISKAVFAYTDSLAKSAEIKALLPQVEKLFQSLINAQIELNQLRRFQDGVFGLSEADFKAEETRIQNAIKSFTQQIKIAKTGLESFAGGALNLSEILFGKTPELKAEKKAKEIKDKAVKELKRRDYSPAILEIKTAAQILIDLQQAQKEINDKIGKVKMIPIKLNLDEGDIVRRAREIAKEVEAINIQMGQTVKNTLNSAFASIGESIATSLGGGASFAEAIFGNLFKVLGAGIKQLGESMIALGTAKMVIEKFKFAPGIATLLAGIATVALGSLLQKAIPGFATGVKNFGGGMAVVGERGPELVRLPRGSDVIPNHQLNGLAAANQQVFIPDIKLRGQDIWVSFKRTDSSIGRNG